MGPNGSGKTTLLRALVSVANIITHAMLKGSRTPKTVPFFSSKTMDEPTRFRVELDANWLDESPGLFRYELVVRGDRILREALFHFPRNRPRRLFERGGPGEPIYVAHEFGITARDDRLKAVREDTSVIATLALLNLPVARLITEEVKDFLAKSNLVEHANWSLPTDAVVDMVENDPDMKEWMEREIQRSDLAVKGLVMNESVRGEKQVGFDHHGLHGPIPLFLESGGTKRLFHLLPQIYLALSSGAPVVVDEIDGDLHVDMVSEILQRFQSPETNPHNAQILVTSHNVGLLDDLEKEELFIVEKGEDGGTRVHGAQDVRGLRRDARLYPKYRVGVLGGLPRIG